MPLFYVIPAVLARLEARVRSDASFRTFFSVIAPGLSDRMSIIKVRAAKSIAPFFAG